MDTIVQTGHMFVDITVLDQMPTPMIITAIHIQVIAMDMAITVHTTAPPAVIPIVGIRLLIMIMVGLTKTVGRTIIVADLVTIIGRTSFSFSPVYTEILHNS